MYKSGTNKIIKNPKLYNLKIKNKTSLPHQNQIKNYNYKGIKYKLKIIRIIYYLETINN